MSEKEQESFYYRFWVGVKTSRSKKPMLVNSDSIKEVLDQAKAEFPKLPDRKITGGELDDLGDYWVATQDWFKKWFEMNENKETSEVKI